MALHPTRREFLAETALAGAGFWLTGGLARAATGSDKDKLNIAVVGCGGRGHHDLKAVSGQNIVALCDVDEKRAHRGFKEHPDARKYKDYRRMLDREDKNIDAVVVATPDHMHALIAMAAMKRGKHVYCEKPLTWCIHEAQAMRQTAQEQNVVTQMGNQGSSRDGFRHGVEMLRANVLGPVREVHVWTNRPIWPQGVKVPDDTRQPPDTLAWNLWLGGARRRAYSPKYMPFKWRGWHDFGTGALGDMACHLMNLPYRGLKLGSPTSVKALTSERYPQSYPGASRITYEFPEREGLPPVRMIWYDGGERPPKALVPEKWWVARHHKKKGKDKDQDQAKHKPGPGDKHVRGNGCLIIGEKGMMYSPNPYGVHQFYEPEEVGEAHVPNFLPRAQGQQAEWIKACKGHGSTYSSFDLAAPLTQTVLLGDLAVRVGKKIEWDARTLRVKNSPEANALIGREYHNGYSL